MSTVVLASPWPQASLPNQPAAGKGFLDASAAAVQQAGKGLGLALVEIFHWIHWG